MKKITVIFIVLFQFAIHAFAQKTAATPVTDPSITDKISEITFEDVRVSSYSTLLDQGKTTDLKMVNHGIRKKKVFGLATVKVYVVEFFAADPTKLDRTEEGILASLKKAGPVELKMTASRDLTGKKISDSFTEALEFNGVDVKNLSKEMTELMAELSSVKELEKGQSFSLLATWKDTSSTLFIKRPDGSIKTITANEGFVKDLFAIWFGKPTDDKLADLKKVLIK